LIFNKPPKTLQFKAKYKSKVKQTRGDHFRFDSVFIKKNNQTEFFFKKNQNRFKPTGFGFVWFGFLEQKQFKPVWLGFFGLAQFWLGFFSIFFGWGSVRFFRFQACKTKTEPNRSVFSKF
jgi:hypothetical protein